FRAVRCAGLVRAAGGGLVGGLRRRLRRGARRGRDLARAPALEEALGRDDERAQAHLTGLAEREGDLLRVAVPDGLAAAGQDGGGVALAADEQRAAGRDGEAAALGGGQPGGLPGAGKGDRLQGL